MYNLVDKWLVPATVSAIAASLAFALTWLNAKKTFLSDYLKIVKAWADQVVNAASELYGLTFLDPAKMQPGEFYGRRHRLIWTLSALLDSGRWIAPNHSPGKLGHDKPHAFKGVRERVLDAVYTLHDLAVQIDYSGQEPNVKLRQDIVDAKREFVSEVQLLIRIRWLRKTAWR